MISLEQIKLLETRVARAIEYVERVTGENNALLQKEVETLTKLESYQKRIDELEVIVMRFKEDQSRIEDGILAALDRLNQFEEAVEKSLNDKAKSPAAGKKTAKPDKPPAQAKEPAKASGEALAQPDLPVAEEPVAEQPVVEEPVVEQPASEQPASEEPVAEQPVAEQPAAEQPAPKQPASGEMFFEIPDDQTEQNIADPATDEDSLSTEGELDIF